MDDLERLQKRAKELLRQYRDERSETKRTQLLAQYADVMQAIRDMRGNPDSVHQTSERGAV